MTTHTQTVSRAAAEPNVTPMLDVLLVLLVTFMSVSIQVHHTIDASLPTPCTGPCASGDNIVLEVRPGPEYRVNSALIPPNGLGAALANIYRTRPEKIIQVAGYPGVSYQQVIAAMDVARAAGVRVIGIAPKESYLTP